MGQLSLFEASMYLLINPDNTVNFADDHPINDALDLNGLRLIEIKEKSLDKVVGEIHPEVAIWDEVSKKVRADPLSVSLRQESVNKRREAYGCVVWKLIFIGIWCGTNKPNY
jgi:hypothetical protein